MKQDVIQKMLKEDPSHDNYVVFSFVGKGGIGKTTLAQCVYNDQKLKDHFQFKAWVCISDVFDVTRVTTEIINSSSQNANLNFCSLNQAQNALIQKIQQKRFLIVLDDIWTEHYDGWRQLITPFQHGERGSRVIVTTRIENVARMVMGKKNPANHINVKGLSNDDCWLLFRQHAHDDIDNDLGEMRDDIVNKCKGLPLAAKALGSLFGSTTDNRQRLNILKSDIWTEKGDVLPILRLSYYHLPSNLKPIFAYCCVLPKDYEFEEMEMILLWMAQGLLVEEKEERIEDSGHLCFQGLVSRSLFERSPLNHKCYVMHDLVHDLAQWAAGSICCCAMSLEGMLKEGERIRHLYTTRSSIDHILMSCIQPLATKLRTLIICSPEVCLDGQDVGFLNLLKRFRCIRTLSLKSEMVKRLPESVGDLKHLRFLDLKFTQLEVFPKSIRKLGNLQILFLEGCCNLREVANIKFLVKLRHLRFHQNLWESIPRGIRMLANLQSLGNAVYIGLDSGSGSIIREFGSLNHLHGKVRLKGLENVKKVDDAREAKFHEKQGLTKMSLIWSRRRDGVDANNERDVLEQLKPHNCIEELKLKRYMGLRLPSWLSDPSFRRMVVLKLLYIENCECLPPLGQLHSLKKLVLRNIDEIKEVGRSVFGGASLEELDISYCASLVHINEIPVSLEKFAIWHCEGIQYVEFEKGVANSTTYNVQKKVCIDINNNVSLVSIGKIPLTVQELQIECCKNLKYMLFDRNTIESGEQVGGIQKDSPIELAHLSLLHINNCENFISSLRNVLLPSIQTMWITNDEKQEAIPEQIHTFTSLVNIAVFGCPNIRCFPKGGLPITGTLKCVEIGNMQIEFPPLGEWGLHLLPHLQDLHIEAVGSITDTIECIPSPHLHLPPLLLRLQIKGFKNLKSLNCNTFQNLTLLWIYDCPKLENLGDYNCLPPNLQNMKIWGCPKIDQQCKPHPNGRIQLNSYPYFGRYIIA